MMNEAAKSALKKSVILLLVLAVLITVACAAFSYDKIEEVCPPRQVVEGVNYLQSQKTVMKSGESAELLCSYSLEALSEDDCVYILRLSLYPGESATTYDIKNIGASLQLPEGVICRMVYCSDGSDVSEPAITYSDGCEVVTCTGGKRLEAEILLTGEIGTCLDVTVTYDIIGSGRRMLMRFPGEATTFELNL
ncbi:MAG: hypothetical protein LUF29_00400 [Oscillospiraceae bacterium]|nr:hypothetical protein [Oscillospiraceae bacterium]